MAKKYYSKQSSMTPKGKMQSGLPTEVVIKDWPVMPTAPQSGFDDTITGIDDQMRSDANGRKSSSKMK